MIDATTSGLAELRAELAKVVPKMRGRALRNALAAGARLVRNAARSAAPVISASAPAVRRGVRKPGTLRQAISVRTSKEAKRRGDVGVFVNVRPAKGAKFKTSTSRVVGIKVRRRSLVKASQRGANNPNDPFYWRWVNFGARGLPGAGFLEAGALRLGAALQVFKQQLPAIVAKINAKQNP